MSYKALIKDIEKNHPMDPDIKERFGWKERLTVKDFEWKLVDALYLYSISQSFQACCKKIKKRFRPPKTSKFVRPDTLNDMPESGSSSDSDPDLKISKGLTTATQ